jgi:ABC-type nitrate/sulfonate/bicarbonate transport system permease component
MRLANGFLWIGKFGIHPLHIAGILSVLLVWEAAAHYLLRTNPFAESLFPPIERVLTDSLPGFAAFGVQLGSPRIMEPGYGPALLVLAEQSAATITRLLIGTTAGIVLGILTGLAMGWSEWIRDLLDPPLELIRMVPSLALLPLFLLWFGGREIGTLLYIGLAIFMIVVISTLVAIRNLPRIHTDYARTLGATKRQVFQTVVVPGIVPGLVGAIRVALGSAWAIVLAGEYLAVPSGLGRLMVLSEMFFFTGRMIVIVILFMIYSAVLNLAFLAVARRLTRWQP